MKRFAACLLLVMIFLVFAVVSPMAAEQEAASAPEKAASVKKNMKKKTARAKVDLMDINTATAEQLMSLPGISKEDAQKIIAGRPYARKSQLKQKNIITAAAYDGIKMKIVAKKPDKKNTK